MTIHDTSDAVVLVVVVAARLILPLYIPRYPLPGILGALVVDAVDQTIFQSFTTIDLAGYQTYDKALDVYYLTVAYASTIRNWGGGYAFTVGRVLWYYRLVGVVFFEYFERGWLLLVFPNTFEYFFIAIEGIKVTRDPFRMSKRQITMLAAGIWVFVKLPQEWWIHVAKLDFTDFVGAHPWAGIVIVATLLVAVALFHRLAPRLPPRDWPPTLSADEQGNNLGWPTPSPTAVPSAFFGWAFVEKAALVTAVTLIFEQILPGDERTPLQVATGTTGIIALSTLLSQWLARRGVTWKSTSAMFVTMAGANTGIAFAVGLLLPNTGARPQLGTLLFLVALMTLIVVLFDRYTRIARERPIRPWWSRARRYVHSTRSTREHADG